MVDIYELMYGDRVRIVSEWGPISQVNPNGLMDHWRGQIMTVRTVNEFGSVKMIEDEGECDFHPPYYGWNWNSYTIDYVVGVESATQYGNLRPLSDLY